MARRFTSDPRVRQRFNQITENLESANERTKTSLFTFSESYVRPCLESLQPCFVSFQTCLEASCQPCCAVRDDIRRHRQPRYARRGRERAAFDFYDDWDDEEEEWGNDEMERLLAGDEPQQPGRRPGMSYGYGTRGGQRRATVSKDPLADDPTLVPQSSIFGFLERLPWKIGGRGTRYRPSPSNLRSNVGKRGQEAEVPFGQEDEAETTVGKKRRPRSATVGSHDTSNSLSSRGDIFPSDDEDDAREIDDEYALALGRRNTGGTSDDLSSKKRKGNSRTSTKSASSKESKSTDKDDRARSASSERRALTASPAEELIPSLEDLKREEHEIQIAEEQEVEQRRLAARQLAAQRGLNDSASPVDDDPGVFNDFEAKDIGSPSQEGKALPPRDAAPAKEEAASENEPVDVAHDSSSSKPA